MNSLNPRRQGRWSQERRLKFLDFRLSWDGVLSRQDLHKQFGISNPQASLDIAEYMKLAPNNLEYDRSAKVYRASPDFTPIFESSGPRQYLTELLALNVGVIEAEESPIGFRPPVAAVPLPTRAVQTSVLRSLLLAIKEKKSLEVDYQSIAREEPRRRLITPQAFGQDGLRWHVRAYCHIRHGYRDFVIGRVLAVHQITESDRKLPPDEEWNRVVTVVLAPHPQLTERLQEGVAIDFNMRAGSVTLKCRQAMLFYLFKSLGLSARGKPISGQRQIVVQNLQNIENFLPEPGQP